MLLLQEWYVRVYQVADEQLRKVYEIGGLLEGRGWITPAAQYPYNNTDCTPEHHCVLRDVSMPASGAVDPCPLYDFSYNGDINTTETPPPEGSVPYYVGDAIKGTLSRCLGCMACVTVFLFCPFIADENMLWLEESDSRFISPVFVDIASKYTNAARDSIDSFLMFLSIFVPTYMVAFVLVIAFMFMPQVLQTNADIHTKRLMLLYLPPQIVARIPSIAAMVSDILATDTSQVGARTRADS
jgi:hypothetical protein